MKAPTKNMPRTKTHKTETATRLIFETAISGYSNPALHITEGDLLFREPDERDYGVDGEVEVFNDEEVTGRLARIQLKGTNKEIVPLKTANFVSCPDISKSSLGYCRTRSIPFILVYVSKVSKKFFFCDLQSVYQDALQRMGDGDTTTIRIPCGNNSDHLDRFVEIIDDYYADDNKQKKVFERQQERDYECMEHGDQGCVDKKCEEGKDNLWDYASDVTAYKIEENQTPADGEHRMVDRDGNTVMIGYWKDAELEKGTEYNHLIRVTKGSLIFKPGCPEDPYDATDDFEYEKLEMYHWEPLTPFHSSEYYIAEVGMHNCYVVDMEVDGELEQMVNIRPLEEFLASKDPRRLKAFKEMIELDREEVLDAGTEANNAEHQGVSQELEAVLRGRQARLSGPKGIVTEVYYSALDFFKLIMENDYGKNDFVTIAAALSRIAIENNPDKDAYWKSATVANAVPEMLNKTAVQELVNILRAYRLIGYDQNGMLYVTEEGKKTADEAVIILDAAEAAKTTNIAFD